MGNQGRKGGFSNNNNYSLKVGEATRIKKIGGNKIVVHLTSKVLSNNNNNPYILQSLKD